MSGVTHHLDPYKNLDRNGEATHNRLFAPRRGGKGGDERVQQRRGSAAYDTVD